MKVFVTGHKGYIGAHLVESADAIEADVIVGTVSMHRALVSQISTAAAARDQEESAQQARLVSP